MNIIVTNFSGNVGKSTVSYHLLLNRLENAQIIPIESINADESEEADKLRGQQFDELRELMAIYDNAIIDVGASNVESFLSFMKKYKNSHRNFDYFIVPTVGEEKQIKDTISTIKTLAAMGVSPEKIIPVFNKVDDDDDVEKIFSVIFDYYEDTKAFNLKPNAVIHQTDIFAKLKAVNATLKDKLTVDDVANDTNDYNALRKATQDKMERVELTRREGLQMLAEAVKDELDSVFNTIMS
jgi:MinD-like ATPase involved in chromosome partitioning or flagellar assembly